MPKTKSENPQKNIQKEPEAPVHFRVRRIKQISLRLLETRPVLDEISSKVELDFKTGLDLSNSLYDITIRIRYKYADTDELFVETEVQNIFAVKNLSEYFVEPKINKIPRGALASMVGLCISHSRVFLYNCLAGTIFNDLMLPIFDAKEVTQHFFPENNS